MYNWETPFLIILMIIAFPYAVLVLFVALAIFTLFIDAVAFAITDFISRYSNSRSNSKED